MTLPQERIDQLNESLELAKTMITKGRNARQSLDYWQAMADWMNENANGDQFRISLFDLVMDELGEWSDKDSGTTKN